MVIFYYYYVKYFFICEFVPFRFRYLQENTLEVLPNEIIIIIIVNVTVGAVRE